MEIQDEKIVRLCKKNNRDGYRMLYDKYKRYVYTLCYRSTFNQEDATDLLQEVFLKVFKALPRFDERKPLLPWIKRIAVNLLINYSKRNSRNEICTDFLEEDQGALIPADYQESPEERFQRVERFSAIEKSIVELPGNERTAIILRHFEGKSYEEIARLMTCPLGSVKTYLYRARRLLREKLIKKGLWEV